MKRLWAPWRAAYVARAGRAKGCIFCTPRREHVILTTRTGFVILNLFPYNAGHVMVVPRRHTAAWSGLTDRECLDLVRLLARTQNLLARKLKAQGFNVGLNVGRAAGAGVAGHLHLHVVPRWTGDTNFMPVLAGTKVMSQSLAALRRILRS